MRLRFWLKTAFTNLFSILGAALLYGVLMNIQGSGDFLENFWMTTPLYLIFFGALMFLALNMGLYRFHLNLSLAFGSTRREALAGLHVARLVPIFLLAVLLFLVTVLAGDNALASPVAMSVSTLGLCLFAAAFGSVLGMVFARFGKIAAIVGGVVLFVVCLGGGIAAGLGIANDSAVAALLSVERLPWLALAIGAAAYLLTLIPEVPLVKKYQVKL